MSGNISEKKQGRGIGFFGLVGLVVSSCVGTGVFALTGSIGAVSAPGPALIAWAIVGAGFFSLALVFSNLKAKRPEIEGISSYATKGFGNLAGFMSGWGYWVSAWIGNVAFATILASTLGYFIPYFLPGNNIGSILLGSAICWGITLLVWRGIESASFLNALIMVAKVAGLAVFALFSLFLFNAGIFTADFWGTVFNNAVAAGEMGPGAISLGSVGEQVVNCLIIMMFVFIGLEGAAVVSERAKNKSQSGRATVVGMVVVLVVYICVSVLPYGYMPYSEIAALDSPAMIYVFEDMAPGWGGAFLSIAMLVSGFGCWLSFTILPTETTSLMSQEGLLTSHWNRRNKFNVPTFSLLMEALCTQVFLVTLLFTQDAFAFAYSLCTVTIIITWAFAAAYQVKISVRERNAAQIALGVFSLAFLVIGTLLSGWQYLLLSCIAYIPGYLVYARARKAQLPEGAKLLSRTEMAVMAVVSALAVLAVVLVVVGVISF